MNKIFIVALLLVGLVVFSLALTFLLIRNNRYKQKINALLQSRNRELEIDAALERVRVSAMAMHKTEDLHHTVSVVFEELGNLNVGVIRCGISVINKEKRTGDIWITSITEQGSAIQVSGDEPFDIHPLLQDAFEAWLSQKDTDYVLQGDDLTQYYQAVNSGNLHLPHLPINLAVTGAERQYCYTAVYRAGGLFAFKETEFSAEAKHLMKRFANVFDLTYKRFLDLQIKEIQTIRLSEEKAKLENTLSELRSTQAQLIQAEKLASLGELTAGIAHEIQNPLNFVNNFSELNRELIAEMKEEIEKGNLSEVKAIATDLAANEEKIKHHGQRASSIVKGMLEHSRASTGVKEPTDLNALADEYLRLAYHGLRAKESNFNCQLETHFDPDLPLVSVIPQDIGRVLLNLINNAFYAVHQRNTDVETLHATSLPDPYQPTVTVSTKQLENAIEIRVQDNGNGIPEAIREKIFQPFFTTKPTGQGTGLGLSLAYDIIKAHSGTLEVISTPKELTTFIISIPA